MSNELLLFLPGLPVTPIEHLTVCLSGCKYTTVFLTGNFLSKKKPNLFSRREKQYFKEPLLFLYPDPTNIFMPVLRAANVTPFFVPTTILQCLFSIFLPYLHITLIIRPKHIPLFYTNPLKTLLPNTTNMNFR